MNTYRVTVKIEDYHWKGTAYIMADNPQIAKNIFTNYSFEHGFNVPLNAIKVEEIVSERRIINFKGENY